MPFRGGRSQAERELLRDIGPLKPPNPGVAQVEDGSIVGAGEADPSIPPGTEVKVNFPAPRERVIDSNGIMSPRWYRFFEELYRRTGGIYDNVNVVLARRFLSTTTGSLALASQAPSAEITHIRQMGAGSLTMTGHESITPAETGSGSLSLTGLVPTVS
jgi:hypothetical protein